MAKEGVLTKLEKGEVKCHNLKCGCRFFPRTFLSSTSVQCPQCGFTVQLKKDFRLGPQNFIGIPRFNFVQS